MEDEAIKEMQEKIERETREKAEKTKFRVVINVK